MRLFLWIFFGLWSLCFYAQNPEEENQKIKQAYKYLKTKEGYKTVEICTQLLKQTQNYDTKMKSVIMLGQYYNTTAVIDSALFYAQKALDLSKNQSGSLHLKRLARVYNIFAIANNQKGLDDKAASWHIKGIEVSEKGEDQPLLFMHQHGLANIYRKQEKYDKAKLLFEKCLTYQHNPRIVYASHINIGIILVAQKQYGEAIQHFNKALAMCDPNIDPLCEIAILNNLGDIALEKKELDKALNYFQKVKSLANSGNFKQEYYLAEFGIAKILKKQHQWKDSYVLLSKLLLELKTNQLYTLQLEVYEQLALVAEKTGNFKRLAQWERERSLLKDSLYAQEKAKEIRELQVKYENLQHQKKITQLQAEKTLQQAKIDQQNFRKNGLIILFLVILIPTIIGFFIYYQKLQTQKQLHQQLKEVNARKITTLTQNQELQLAKATIAAQDEERKKIAAHLHDSVGSNLATIKLQLSRLDKQMPSLKESVNLLDSTYTQIRNLSHALQPSNFVDNAFLELVENYTKHLATVDQLEVSLHAYPKNEINQLNVELLNDLFILLQELLTNVIKHAKAQHVDISFNLLSDHLNLIFEDDGNGFDPKNSADGIGLNNIKHRVQLWNGNFEIDTRTKRGTIVSITIPLNLTEDED